MNSLFHIQLMLLPVPVENELIKIVNMESLFVLFSTTLFTSDDTRLLL